MDQSPERERRIAFFGGSFDPPHRGHLAIARAAQNALDLDTVLFVPVGAQPLKPEGSAASFKDRLEMTRLAIAGEVGFAVSMLDAPGELATPNYTVDSLLRLHAQLPPDGALFCLMGADSFLSLRRWHRGAEIPFLANLIVASRPGMPLDDIQAALAPGLTVSSSPAGFQSGHGSAQTPVDLCAFIITSPDGRTAPLYLLPGLHIDLSASEIRAVTRGMIENAGLPSAADSAPLCPAVLNYIRVHGLYR